MNTPLDITEAVEIWTREPRRRIDTGILAIADDGLPFLRRHNATVGELSFRPWAFPANWLLKPLQGRSPDMLLGAWEQIEGIREELAEWRKERMGEHGEEGERIRERCDIDLAKADMEMRGER